MDSIYFLEQGQASYCLPRFQNRAFVIIEEGETFGVCDILFRYYEIANNPRNEDAEEPQFSLEDPIMHKFTTHTN